MRLSKIRWMGQRNPGPPKGWLKPTVNHGMFTTDQLVQNIRTGQWGTSSQLLNKTTDATANRANLRQKKTTWAPSRNFIYLWKMPKKLAWWFICLNMEVFHFERVNFNHHSITMSVGESPLYHLSLLYPTNYIPSKSIKISWKSLTIPSNSHIFMVNVHCYPHPWLCWPP